MILPRPILRRLRAWFRREKLDAEMSEEMRAHLELQIEENLRRGMTADAARHAALRAFGGVEQVKERARDQRALVWLELLGRDFKFAARGLAKTPGFAVVAIATLAIGIGVNLAIAALGNAILFRPLPAIDEPERLAIVARVPRERGITAWSHAELEAFRRGTPGCTGLAASSSGALALAADQLTERVQAQFVSANFFELLGVRPAVGRGFLPEEETNGAAVAVISHRLWQRRWQGDTGVIGRSVRLNGQSFTIVGVAEQGFRAMQLPTSYDVWVPLAARAVLLPGRRDPFDPEARWLNSVVGRLAEGATFEQVTQQIEAAAQAIEPVRAGQPRAWEARLRPYRPFPGGDHTAAVMFLGLLAGVTALVLAVVAANVAGLFLSRGLARRREIAMRLALGGSRGRVVRQTLAEALLIAAVAAGLALLGAQFVADWLMAAIPGENNEPAAIDVVFDGAVVGIGVALIFIAALAVAVVPAWQASRVDLLSTLKSGDGTGVARPSRLRSGLVVFQVALSTVLVICAALLGRSLQALRPGGAEGAADRIVIADLDPRGLGYDVARAGRLFDSVAARLRESPGIAAASLAAVPPYADGGINSGEFYGGNVSASAPLECEANVVAPGYFDTLGAPLTRGRDFTAGDAARTERVVIVNQLLAESLWPGRDPVGQRLESVDPEERPWRVVGVVALQDPAKPRRRVYAPLAQRPLAALSVIARTSGEAAALGAQVRKVVRDLEPDLPVHRLATLRAAQERTWWQERMVGALVAFGSVTTLVLAMVGLYALVTQDVLRRTREIGVRLAIGAAPGAVVALVLRRGVRLTIAGLTVGTIAAVGAGRLLRGLLQGVGAGDGPVFAGAAAALLLVAGLACWLPARRAARIDAMTALRAE